MSAGRKNRLWFELSGSSEALGFDQEQPETLWIGPSGSATCPARPRHAVPARRGRYVTLPGGHPQGFHDCFDAFVAETYATVRGGRPAEGLPLAADGLRAVR